MDENLFLHMLHNKGQVKEKEMLMWGLRLTKDHDESTPLATGENGNNAFKKDKPFHFSNTHKKSKAKKSYYYDALKPDINDAMHLYNE